MEEGKKGPLGMCGLFYLLTVKKLAQIFQESQGDLGFAKSSGKCTDIVGIIE